MTTRTVPTWQRVERATSRLSTMAVQRMGELSWFEAMPARSRAAVGLVVQAGLRAFTAWLRDPLASRLPAPEVFAAAPRDLARSVTLKQTVQLIRVAVGVVEDEVPQLADPAEQAALTGQVLRYSRELAFAAAEVYATAAEARGAWDARLEAGVVEALVRGQVSDTSLSRAAALGWAAGDWCTALAARTPSAADAGLEALRAAGRHRGWSVLSAEAGGGLLVVVGGPGGPGGPVGQGGVPLSQVAYEAAAELAEQMPEGPVVVGPCVADLAQAAPSVAEALAGLAAVPAWPDAPRPVRSGELLAERAVLGDATARSRLLRDVYAPLAEAGGDLLRTAAAFLDGGGSVEGTGRALFLHANTVRYRLRKVLDVLGYDLSRPRDAQVVRLALVLGRAGVDPEPAG